MACACPDRPRRAPTAIALAAGVLLLATSCGGRQEGADAPDASARAPPAAPDPARARLLQSPQVRHWQEQQRFSRDAREFLRTAASLTLNALGLEGLARRVAQSNVAQAVDRLTLDGMIALWQPATSD